MAVPAFGSSQSGRRQRVGGLYMGSGRHPIAEVFLQRSCSSPCQGGVDGSLDETGELPVWNRLHGWHFGVVLTVGCAKP